MSGLLPRPLAQHEQRTDALDAIRAEWASWGNGGPVTYTMGPVYPPIVGESASLYRPRPIAAHRDVKPPNVIPNRAARRRAAALARRRG